MILCENCKFWTPIYTEPNNTGLSISQETYHPGYCKLRKDRVYDYMFCYRGEKDEEKGN